MTDAEIKKIKKSLVRRDKKLKSLFERHRIEWQPKLTASPYETLVRSIAHQQLSGKAAQTVIGRMLSIFPDDDFPRPEDILKVTDEQLRNCGFSGSKVRAIKDIAAKTVAGIVPSRTACVKMSNDEIIERLIQIHGVGRWTVEMFLIFNLGRLDIWPIDDFGIRRGYQVWKRLREMPVSRELRGADVKWAPHQTIVSLHLWREADLWKNEKPKKTAAAKKPATKSKAQKPSAARVRSKK